MKLNHIVYYVKAVRCSKNFKITFKKTPFH